MGFLKKLKETAEKGIEKGVELGAKGYDSAKDAAKRGYDNAKDTQDEKTTNIEPQTSNQPESVHISSPNNQFSNLSESTKEALQALKLRFVKGEISKQEYEEMKIVLIESN